MPSLQKIGVTMAYWGINFPGRDDILIYGINTIMKIKTID
jgi:hypothetical protein